jgi:AraC-like DNA-binding protein
VTALITGPPRHRGGRSRSITPGATAAPVGVVVDRTGLSHRRFLGLFTEQVGLTPKRFCRVRRFQRVLQHLHAGGRAHWTEVALSCGYYDQAHFIKEFELFSGINPSTYRRSQIVHVNHVPL